MNVAVFVGGSIFEPQNISVTISSGMSLISIHPATSRLGVSLKSTKVICSECNTPIAEIAAGSLIIKNKHHSQRHATVIPINDELMKYT